MKAVLIILCLCVTTVLAQSESHQLKFYDTTKINPKVLNEDLTVEIGDSSKVNFDPSFAITAWRGECKMRVNLSTAAHPMNGASKDVSSLGGKSRVTLSTASVEHDMFAVDDGFEWYIVLNEKPATNVFTYDIETENLVYSYQVDSADTFDLPDSLNGCYFAYHATKRDNYRYVSPKDTTYENHATGGAFAIFRPKAWDALEDDTTWCSLYIDDNGEQLSVTVPQKFLDDAVYPLVIDPKFGNEGVEGSNQFFENFIVGNYLCPPSSSGTLDSITVYILTTASGSWKVHGAVYKHSDNSLIDTTELRTIDAVTDGWETFDLRLDGQVVASTNYQILCWAEDVASQTIYMKVKTFDGTCGMVAKGATFGAWTDPLTGMVPYADRDASIYAWYTSEAAAGQVIIIGTD